MITEKTERNKQIKELYSRGDISTTKLAVQFGLSEPRVWRIINGYLRPLEGRRRRFKKVNEWKRNNKNVEFYKFLAKKHTRLNRLKRLKVVGSHTWQEWEDLKKKYNYCCAICGKREPFKNQYYKFLTEDHKLAIVNGGTDNINNIQPACFRCNSSKQDFY